LKQKKYPVSITFPIRWGEMDALGHVNNTMYFRYFEDARLAYMQKIGFGNFLPEDNLGALLAYIDCQFKKPVTFPDTLTIGIWVEKIGNTSLQMDYDVYSEQLQGLVAKGSSVVVLFNYQANEKVRVPEKMSARIEAMGKVE